MEKLFNAVEKDKLAGVHKRSDGRLFYIQRKVEFETIDFNPEYIFSEKWSIFNQPLTPINWTLPIEELEKQLTEFSLECSKRFHHLWYKYIDIMLARSISINDKNLYLKDFIKPSIFLDLGIPENPEWTNVPRNIHNKILEEYLISKKFLSNYRIFYLTQYLENLTEDINQFLLPYKELWELESTKLQLYEDVKNYIKNIYENNFFEFLKKQLDEFCINNLLNKKINLENSIISSIYFRISQKKEFFSLSHFERKIILENLIQNKIIDKNYQYLFILNEYTIFPNELERLVRKVLFLENQLHKEKIYQLKILYHQSKKIINHNINQEVKNSEKENILIQEKINAIFYLTEFFNLKHHQYLDYFINLYNKKVFLNIFEFPNFLNKNFIENSNRIKNDILNKLRKISEINYKILEYYKKSFYLSYKEFFPNHKYIDRLKFPKNLITGNPFNEKEILEFFKNLIKERLKPIRMASNEYSLLYNEKHGILTLNPVLKLWKNQIHFQKEVPEIAQLELNTPITIECLIELIKIVDPDISKREIIRGSILKQIRGKENLENLTILLIPGSCYPLKEIPSSHFPQFKNKIIGEKRFINEVGIKETHYILTGAWYNKKNHTLYYPIGGDNAELLKKIYLGIRTDIIPAFFFAIGQYVFETLPDTILYYKTTKLTFREIILKIYKNQNYSEKELKKIRLFTKEEIKFQFAIYYSLLVMENLTGGLHIQNKISELYKWFFENLNIKSIFILDKEKRKEIRLKAQNMIHFYNEKFLLLKE